MTDVYIRDLVYNGYDVPIYFNVETEKFYAYLNEKRLESIYFRHVLSEIKDEVDKDTQYRWERRLQVVNDGHSNLLAPGLGFYLKVVQLGFYKDNPERIYLYDDTPNFTYSEPYEDGKYFIISYNEELLHKFTELRDKFIDFSDMRDDENSILSAVEHLLYLLKL